MHAKRLYSVPILALLLTSVGCVGTYTGGGFTDSSTGPGAKSIFGFNLQATDNDGDDTADVAKGQFQFHDAAANVHFHADMSNQGGNITSQFPPVAGGTAEVAIFSGTYTPQPRNLGTQGRADVWLFDLKTGPNAGKRYIWVVCEGGFYTGYTNGGPAAGPISAYGTAAPGLPISGGTISFH